MVWSSALFSSIWMINHHFYTDLKDFLGFILNSSKYCVLFLNLLLVCSPLYVSIFRPFQTFSNDNGFVAAICYVEGFLIIFLSCSLLANCGHLLCHDIFIIIVFFFFFKRVWNMYLFILVIIHSPMFMGLSLVAGLLQALGFRWGGDRQSWWSSHHSWKEEGPGQLVQCASC